MNAFIITLRASLPRNISKGQRFLIFFYFSLAELIMGVMNRLHFSTETIYYPLLFSLPELAACYSTFSVQNSIQFNISLIVSEALNDPPLHNISDMPLVSTFQTSQVLRPIALSPNLLKALSFLIPVLLSSNFCFGIFGISCPLNALRAAFVSWCFINLLDFTLKGSVKPGVVRFRHSGVLQRERKMND